MNEAERKKFMGEVDAISKQVFKDTLPSAITTLPMTPDALKGYRMGIMSGVASILAVAYKVTKEAEVSHDRG